MLEFYPGLCDLVCSRSTLSHTPGCKNYSIEYLQLSNSSVYNHNLLTCMNRGQGNVVGEED